MLVHAKRIGKRGGAGERHAGSDVFAAQLQAPRRVRFGTGEPLLEAPSVHHVRRDPGIVEREHRIVAHHRSRRAELVLGAAKPRQLLRVAANEGMGARISVLHETAPDEHLPRPLPAHRREAHPAPGDEGQPVQRHLLEDHRLGATRIPMGFEVGAAHEIAGRLLHPLRAHPTGDEGVRTLGLHHFRGDDPRCNRGMEDRARREPEGGPAKTAVQSVRRAGADAAQQSGEQGAVNATGRGSESAGLDSELAADVADLAVDVEPVPHPGRRQGMAPAEPAHRLARLLRHRAEAAPEIDDSEEVGAGVGDAADGGVSRRLAPRAPLARVGHTQKAHDDQQVGDASECVRFKQHAPGPRVEGEPREPASELREIPISVDGAQLAQQPQAVVDVAPVGGIDEREPLHLVHPQRQHAQQDRGQVGAPDLRLREGRPGLEVGCVIEPDAHPGAGPPAPSGALVGRGPRDGLHRQPLHSGAVCVPAHPGGARIDDEADARHRQRGLRDVRREHHAAADGGSEQRLLARRGHAGMEGKELGIREREAPHPGLGLADLALPGEEHEHVPRLVAQLFQHARDLLRDVVAFLSRPIPDLDGVGPALHLDDRRPIEERLQLLDFQRGGSDDDPEIRAPLHELAEIAEHEVHVQRPLVRLVDDEGVVGAQIAVALDLGEQDAVGHQLDAGIRRGVPVEAHLVADEPAGSGTELRRDPRRDASRRDPPGLRVADHRPGAPPRPETDLRELGALARPGRADHQGDGVLGDRAGDGLRVRGDREIRGDLYPRPRRILLHDSPWSMRRACVQARSLAIATKTRGIAPRLDPHRRSDASRPAHRGPVSGHSFPRCTPVPRLPSSFTKPPGGILRTACTPGRPVRGRHGTIRWSIIDIT